MRITLGEYKGLKIRAALHRSSVWATKGGWARAFTLHVTPEWITYSSGSKETGYLWNRPSLEGLFRAIDKCPAPLEQESGIPWLE